MSFTTVTHDADEAEAGVETTSVFSTPAPASSAALRAYLAEEGLADGSWVLILVGDHAQEQLHNQARADLLRRALKNVIGVVVFDERPPAGDDVEEEPSS